VELRRYLKLIRRRLLLVVITAIVGAAVGYVTTSQAAIYRATATIYVGQSKLQDNAADLYGVTGFDQIVSTFAQMIPSEVIAQDAILATDIDRSAGAVAAATTATVVTNTNLIDVSVEDGDPVVAERLTNAVAAAFATQVAHYDPTPTAGTLPSEPAYVFQDAGLPTVPLSDHLAKKVALGGVVGLILAILGVLLLDYLDVSVKGPEDLERRVDLPVLAIIPLQRRPPSPPGFRPTLLTAAKASARG
jgi:capsular polysaccharide biosynthesis protein